METVQTTHSGGHEPEQGILRADDERLGALFPHLIFMPLVEPEILEAASVYGTDGRDFWA